MKFSRRHSSTHLKRRLRDNRCRAAFACFVVMATFAGSILAQIPRDGRNQAPARGEQGNDPADPRPPRDAELMSLVDLASGVPPEFAARLYLNLVKSGRIKDASWRRELLEAAFDLGSRAQVPGSVIYAGGDLDTESGYRWTALDEFGLDGLTLRCHAVDLLLDDQPILARRLFEQLEPDSGLPMVECRDDLVPDPSVYYRTLLSVSKRSFSARERRRKLDLRFVEGKIAKLRSPTQVGPAARIVLAVECSNTDRTSIALAFAQSIRLIQVNDRAFMTAMQVKENRAAMTDLALAFPAKSPTRKSIVGTFRSYVVRQLNGARCEDTVGSAVRFFPKFVNELNAGIFESYPIRVEEVSPQIVGSSFEGHAFWVSRVSRESLAAFRHLAFGPDRVPRPFEERNSVGWKLEFDSFLNKLRTWTLADESSEQDYFNQRSILYGSALRIAVDKSTVDAVASDFTTFVKNRNFDLVGRAEWWWFVDQFVAQIPKELPDARDLILERFTLSGDQSLALYARMEMLGLRK